MSLPITPELEDLFKKFEPYIVPAVGPKFKEDTPKEILELHKKYVQLGKEQEEFEMSLW